MGYNTVLFHPKYDSYGNLYTIVIENDGAQKISKSPTDLIDFNLNYYGYSLRGANDGAKAILGDIKMFPVAINERLNLYWFPTKSPNRDDCMWIGLHHIKEYKKMGAKETLLVFKNGFSLVLDISVASFNQKVQRAYKLKGELEGRTKNPLLFGAESKDVSILINELLLV